MTIALKTIVNYETLGVIETFQSTCFEHAFFKACQLAIENEKVCKSFKYVSIRSIQTNL
jgi:hypothetical protein